MSPHDADVTVMTPADANRMLPLVRRIVADILERGYALNAILGEGQHEDGALRRRERELENEILALMEELEALGCVYEDNGFRIGRVDFPGRLLGRDVWFTWRSDEPRVAWYRDLDDDADARRPVPESVLRRPAAEPRPR